MMLFDVWIIVGWLACGVGAAGLFFADFRASSTPTISARQDLGIALLLGIVGPISLVSGFLLTGFGEHGWRLWETRHAKAKA